MLTSTAVWESLCRNWSWNSLPFVWTALCESHKRSLDWGEVSLQRTWKAIELWPAPRKLVPLSDQTGWERACLPAYSQKVSSSSNHGRTLKNGKRKAVLPHTWPSDVARSWKPQKDWKSYPDPGSKRVVANQPSRCPASKRDIGELGKLQVWLQLSSRLYNVNFIVLEVQHGCVECSKQGNMWTGILVPYFPLCQSLKSLHGAVFKNLLKDVNQMWTFVWFTCSKWVWKTQSPTFSAVLPTQLPSLRQGAGRFVSVSVTVFYKLLIYLQFYRSTVFDEFHCCTPEEINASWGFMPFWF